MAVFLSEYRYSSERVWLFLSFAKIVKAERQAKLVWACPRRILFFYKDRDFFVTYGEVTSDSAAEKLSNDYPSQDSGRV